MVLIAKWEKMFLKQEAIARKISTDMPVMLRPKGEMTRIAYSILGKPSPLNFKQTSAFKKASKTVSYQNTSRIR